VSAIAQSMTQVLKGLRVGLGQASFQQRRQLVELLIDRVVVTDGQVEIRSVIPTTPGSTQTRFCHLRTDYFDHVALPVAHRIHLGWPTTPSAPPRPGGLLVGPLGDGVSDPAPAQQPAAGAVAGAPIGHQVRWALTRPIRPWARDPDGVQQRLKLGAFVALASSDQHRQWPAAAITSQLQLGREATPAAAQCLVWLSSRP
jgi:hypothetical protein